MYLFDNWRAIKLARLELLPVCVDIDFFNEIDSTADRLTFLFLTKFRTVLGRSINSETLVTFELMISP